MFLTDLLAQYCLTASSTQRMNSSKFLGLTKHVAKKSFPVLHLPPGNSRVCSTALYHEKLRITSYSRLTPPHCSCLPKSQATPSCCPATVIYNSTSHGCKNRFSGDTEHVVCSRGLKTLISSSKHRIKRDLERPQG